MAVMPGQNILNAVPSNKRQKECCIIMFFPHDTMIGIPAVNRGSAGEDCSRVHGDLDATARRRESATTIGGRRSCFGFIVFAKSCFIYHMLCILGQIHVYTQHYCHEKQINLRAVCPLSK